jgi:hypothetical protein
VFKWDTLTAMGPHDLPYAQPVPGITYEVELTSGQKIRVWRSKDSQQ